MRFRDRADAGRQLADRLDELEGLEGEDIVVLCLPRGGVPVGLELARRLRAGLDVIGVRKLGAPQRPEFGIGAVAEDGIRVVDDRSVSLLGLDEEDVEAIAQRERARVAERIARYRGDRSLPDLVGRTVIVVDDGLATGVTARAALRAVRGRQPARLILAVPVAHAGSVEEMAGDADEVVCVHATYDFMAVGAWYDDFEQVTDAQVADMLAEGQALTGRRRR